MSIGRHHCASLPSLPFPCPSTKIDRWVKEEKKNDGFASLARRSLGRGRSVGTWLARVATQQPFVFFACSALPSPPLRALRSPTAEVHEMSRWSTRRKKFARIAASDKREHNDGRGLKWCAGSSCAACNSNALPCHVCFTAAVREEAALLSCNRVYDYTTPHISASLYLSPFPLNPSTDHKNIPLSHLLERRNLVTIVKGKNITPSMHKYKC